MLPVTPNLPKLWRPVRRFLAVLAVSCVLAAIYTSTGVQAQSTISLPQVVWYLFALPPAHILSGPDTDQGFADSEMRYFQQAIAGFDQQTSISSVQRMIADAANQDGTCAVALLYTPQRQKTLIFSRHRWRIEANRVIYRQRDAERFAPYIDNGGKIDLNALQKDRSLVGGFVDERFYSQVINNLIANRKKDDPIYSVENNESAVRMIALGRIDYMFGYPYEVRYLARRQNLDLISESAPAQGDTLYLDLRPACSKGPIGEKMITSIDALLENQPLPMTIVEAYSRWMGPTGYVFEDAPVSNN